MLCKQRKSENIFVIFDIELQTDMRLSKEQTEEIAVQFQKRMALFTTLSLFYKQQFISNKLETGQIFRKNKQLTGHFLKK